VGQVRKAALVVQNVVTYTAIIATSNPNLELFPGMTANVRIIIDTRENALKVPNAALRFRPAGAGELREPGGVPAPAGAPASDASGAGKGGGAQAAQALRERLTKELSLNAEQQAKLEAIQNETRDRIRALTAEDPEERRKQAERLRTDSRLRIAEILDPDQRARYEEMNASRRGSGVTSGRVWVVDDTGKLRSVNVRIGLADGTSSEVVSGALQEGTQVVIGTRADKMARTQAKGGPRFGF
jgi:HlyD family secretion protein